jgi:hypothetical protein
MLLNNSLKNRLFLVMMAAFSVLSVACGLFDLALDVIIDSGMEALQESGVADQIVNAIKMAEGQRVYWSQLEAPGSEFLFEVDPFEDVIRWRFYAVKDTSIDPGEFYINLLPDFVVESDQLIDDQRFLVLSARQPLSSIYSKEPLQSLGTDYVHFPSTLLDVEVLHSGAHRDLGRLAIADMMGLLPGGVPEDTALVILAYNLSSAD